MQAILSLQNLSKRYNSGPTTLTVLHDVSLDLEAGTACAVVGPSGSGKTTLLGLCAGLDSPSAGKVVLDGIELGTLTEDERARVRNQTVGFVFQNFQLIPTLTALENVMVPLELRGEKNVKRRAEEWLARVGLADRLQHYPVQLSGGEQQRVALARAFINHPKILFADEPTGNLDTETGASIQELLFDLNQSNGTTLMIATHNSELAHKTRRILRLRAGALISDERVSHEKTAHQPTI